MVDYTTVKIDKVTLRLLIQFKALLERITGRSLSFDIAILIATITADWRISLDLGFTQTGFIEYTHNMLEKIKTKDEIMEIYSIFEEAEALGYNLKKEKTKEKK